jgi:hypothetical protein
MVDLTMHHGSSCFKSRQYASRVGGHVTATGALVDYWGEATYNATFCAGRVAAGGAHSPRGGPTQAQSR